MPTVSFLDNLYYMPLGSLLQMDYFRFSVELSIDKKSEIHKQSYNCLQTLRVNKITPKYGLCYTSFHSAFLKLLTPGNFQQEILGFPLKELTYM